MKEIKMKDYYKHWFDMKVNVWHPLVVMALMGLTLTGCVDNMDNSEEPGEETTTGDDASDKRPFKVVQTVVNNNGGVDEDDCPALL